MIEHNPGAAGHIGQAAPCGPDCEDCAWAAAGNATDPPAYSPAPVFPCCESRDDCDGPGCQCPCHDAATGGA